MWGTDDLRFLSQYDGLSHIRLTPLGAFCLGLADTYTPTSVETHARLSVLPSLHIKCIEGELTPEESLTLETWAERLDPDRWLLDRKKALEAVSKGLDMTELTAFLKARDDQPLPEAVESFVNTCQTNGKALSVAGTALLIDCQSEDTAEAIATHKETAKLCVRAGRKQLAVRLEHEEKFRALVQALGYGIAARVTG